MTESGGARGALVLDASVVINLLATERPWEILSCQGASAVVPEQVVAEVRRCPVTRKAFDDKRHPLRISPNVSVEALSLAELDLFVDLAASMGDGEAASITLAVSRGFSLAIDDRRARKIAGTRFPALRLWWSTQLLRAREVKSAFSKEEADGFVEAAIQLANMYPPGGLQ